MRLWDARGAGKSTLANLLPRLLATPRGTVFLDGTDICDLPLAHVRRSVGLVQQSAFLFSTTVGRNIAYSLSDPDSEEVRASLLAAARDAALSGDLKSLPDGMETIVGERGVQLSGGQRQRVSVARAFIYDPVILVLDDPLSAVDAESEQTILDALMARRDRRSMLLVTHRVSAAARCDRVIVLDAGRVIETGTHAELVGSGGLYATFAEEQRLERERARIEDFAATSLEVASP